ncbi:RING finger protein 44-like [Salvia hispanica]|uniref:RING finger protein 44-like n=1 Tax=Salvia hispanica TaxID=49212 RepID=UPI002008F154|nr:RING finger protein 44-like [Salvia hispanica]
MDATQTETHALESETILWWPWSMEEYEMTATWFNELAQHERTTVDILPFEATPPPGFSSFLPNCYGLHIRVWTVTNTDDHVDSPEDDVLSSFKTRCCDETDQDEEEVCCICLDDLYRESVTSLDCGHEFHPDCIRRWLVRGKNFCPLCKATAIKEPLHLMLDSLSIN